MDALRAPLTEDEFKTMAVTKLPIDFTGEKYVRFANQCWAWMEHCASQPFTAEEREHYYPMPGRYANVTPAGFLTIAPKYLPIVSIGGIYYKRSYFSDWTPVNHYVVMDDTINVYGAPVLRGDEGMVKLVYVSGYDPIPDDLKLLLALFMSQKSTAGTFSQIAGSAIVPTWLPDEVKVAIEHYKRVR